MKKLLVKSLIITIFLWLFPFCHTDNVSKKERLLLGEKGYQLFISPLNEKNPNFLLISASPRVAEYFNYYSYELSFLADWVIKGDTLILTHDIGHEYVSRRRFRLPDTLYIFKDNEFYRGFREVSQKWLIKQDTLFELINVLDPELFGDSIDVVEIPYYKVDDIQMKIILPDSNSSHTVCQGG